VSDVARQAVAGIQWWHVIDVASGVTTPGSWDLRPTARRMPWPSSLKGLRCLDVGTMDGFWAFELERRGAGEVVAIDVDPARYDVPAAEREQPPSAHESRERDTFRLAATLLESRVRYRHLSVYDLDPHDIGEFDVVFMGYVLQQLRDPLRGLEAVRRVCRGHLILLDTVRRPLSLIPVPLARLDARRDGTEWFVFNPRGLVKALRLAGFEVEAVTPILRDRRSDYTAANREPAALAARAMYTTGLRGRSGAVRARPIHHPQPALRDADGVTDRRHMPPT
jgi:tRNA (mo5U34)-methyltransferase